MPISGITSCTKEEPLLRYSIVITNFTGHAVNVSLYSENQLFEEVSIQTTESHACDYSAEFFQGIYGCLNSNRAGIDSIRFVFENGAGYVCTDFVNSNEFCFGNNRLLFEGPPSEAFRDNGNNEFEFILNPEDFLNAFNLEE